VSERISKLARPAFVAGSLAVVGAVWVFTRDSGGTIEFPRPTADAAVDAGIDAPDAAAGTIDPNTAWTRVEIASIGACDGADGVDVADYDGDGDLDITTACEQGNKVIVARNDSCASSWTVTTIATGLSAPEDSRFGDVDGDGDLDIVIAESGGLKVRWYANTGGTFGSATTVNSGQQRFMHALVLSTGVIVAGGYSTGATVDRYTASAPYTSWTRTELTAANWVKGLQKVGSDVLVWDYLGALRGVRWITNVATSPAAGERLTSDSYTLRGFYDSDGTITTAVGTSDGVSAGESFRIVGSTSPTFPTSFGRVQAIATGDIDDDGTDDIVVTASHAGATTNCVTESCDTAVSSVLWLKGPGYTQRGEVSGVQGIKHDNPVIADFDCDGDEDIAVTEEKYFGLVMFANPLDP
jgi:hypothetical protein